MKRSNNLQKVIELDQHQPSWRDVQSKAFVEQYFHETEGKNV